MARVLTCHKCRRTYTGGRCPACYPRKRRGRSSRSTGGSGRRRWRADLVLGRSFSPPVNPEAVPQQEQEPDADQATETL